MAYKIGFLLSLVFVVQLFLLAGDIMAVQVLYTNLDAVSVTAGHLISQRAAITQEIVDLVKDETGGYIVEVGESTKQVGSLFKYKIAKNYDPFLLSNEVMEVSVVRSVVIGY